LPGPGAPVASPLLLSPSQIGEGVAVIGIIETLQVITPKIQLVGGEIIPIDSTSLLLAGAQTFSWMIPVVLSVLGIGLFVASRKSENS